MPQNILEHVKEYVILVYSSTLEATEPKTIFLVSMDTKCGKLARATHTHKKKKTVEEVLYIYILLNIHTGVAMPHGTDS